jgi:hypothetical protein
VEPIDLSDWIANGSGARVKGEIFESKDAILLSEDLLEVSLPSGRTIDVGWYPEHDPSGAYRVTLYLGHAGAPLKQFETRDVYEALEEVRVLIETDQAFTAGSLQDRSP